MTSFRDAFAMPWLHHFNGGSLQTNIGQALNIVNFPLTILMVQQGKVVASGLAIRGKNIDKVLTSIYSDN